MANIYKGTLGLIGNTPLVEVANVEKDQNLNAKILVKLDTSIRQEVSRTELQKQ